MADPKSGYFTYNGKVYERAYRPLDKAWTVMDDSGKGLDYGTNKAIYDAANVATDIYEDIASARQAAAAPSSTPFAGHFTGNLRSYQSRKDWVQQHKDYLKEKGAGINWDNYSGTAEQNLALKRLLGGYDAWEHQQVEKEKERNKDLVRLEPQKKYVGQTLPKTTPTSVVSVDIPELNDHIFNIQGLDGTNIRSSRKISDGLPTDSDLLNMEGKYALYLNKEDYGRWIGLQTGHRQARPYVTTSDIQTAGVPYATTNPYLAATPIPEVVSNPITQEMKFKMNPLGYTYRPSIKRTGGKVNYYNFFK